ncbi:MarR family winged helix-turn-helix transcriptional regulator [Clostridium polynesiense]|uniref:MarR family winged helix-turn-helix transcriptional regulator n=1 Tax=Clostridium polynesiense TaxID=1325933 RepID=UPI00058BDD56|nr:MarR family transcriptional regulator [Clostridium polynesiense]
MDDNRQKEIAAQLLDIIPIFKNKFMKPIGEMVHGGLKPSEFFVLMLLCENKSFTMTELANKLEISKTNLTPMVDKLIEGDYIHRFRDERDKRVIRVEISSRGKDLIDKHKDVFERIISEKLKILSSKDLNDLSEIIEKFHNIVLKL